MSNSRNKNTSDLRQAQLWNEILEEMMSDHEYASAKERQEHEYWQRGWIKIKHLPRKPYVPAEVTEPAFVYAEILESYLSVQRLESAQERFEFELIQRGWAETIPETIPGQDLKPCAPCEAVLEDEPPVS